MQVAQGLSGSCFTPFPSVGKVSLPSHSSEKQPTGSTGCSTSGRLF
ncbi:hypothetical protein CGRA01v4_01027 [Colletotrichum graminicola]|nr:hypothetical protein CGRA01v4_01027 [Colletotrichum graminicola]